MPIFLAFVVSLCMFVYGRGQRLAAEAFENAAQSYLAQIDDASERVAIQAYRNCRDETDLKQQGCEVEALKLMEFRGLDVKQGSDAIQRYISASQNWR